MKHLLILKYFCIAFLLNLFVVHQGNAQFTLPKILKHPGRIKIKPLHQLNSTYRETNISISPNGKILFFMTGRGGQPWSMRRATRMWKGKPEFSGDIYYSRKVNGNWQYPTPLPSTINTNDGEDEPNISPDGQVVYYQSWYRGWERLGGPYYKAQRYGNRWMRPKGLGDGISQFFKDRARKQRLARGFAPNNYATDGATMSADGKTFIVAVGVYNGKMDLYISKKGRYGRWSYLRRLSVSTRGNERSPFLAADGKTLYFASDGYGGYGGLEILKTTLNPDGSHGKVVNLGAPFNTYLDDYGFIMPASGDDAYFVRQGDIYYADVKNANPLIKPSITLMISGKVTDSRTNKGLGAVITIKDAATNKVIASARSNAFTGEYAIMLPSKNPNIIQEVSKPKYSSFNKKFNTSLHKGLNEIISNVPLDPNQNNTVLAGKSLLIMGVVTNAKTNKAMKAKVVIRDSKTQRIIKTVYSSAITGLYKVKIPVNQSSFMQEVSQKDFDEFNKSFSPTLKTGANQVVSNVKLNPLNKPKPMQLMLSGIIKNKKTQKGMTAKIIIKDAKTNKVIKTLYSNSNGNYNTSLPTNNPNFIQEVTQKGFNGENRNLTATLKPGMNTISSNVSLEPTPKPMQLMLSGIIKNKKTQKGMTAKITIKDAKTNKVIKTLYSSRNGSYSTPLPTNNPNFIQEVTQKGFNKANRTLTAQLKPGMNKISSNISLDPIQIIVKKPKIEEAAAETGRK